ncbi:MAG: hypothetical protein VB144_00880 [Clostridia bacterium]|nr:hypothetical protein [Clostridia bacterium]
MGHLHLGAHTIHRGVRVASQLMLASVLTMLIIFAVIWAKSGDVHGGSGHAILARGFLVVAGLCYILLVCKTSAMVLRQVFQRWPR